MKVRTKINDIYYYMVMFIAFHQCISDTAVFGYTYAYFQDIIKIVIILLAGVQVICIDKYNRKQMLILIYLLLSVITSIIVGTTWLMYLFFIVLYIKDKDIKRVIKIITVMSSIFFSISFIRFFLEYLFWPENLQVICQYGEDVRYFIYYSSPNNAARSFLFTILGFIFLKYENLKVRHWIFVISASIIIFYFTKSDALIIILLVIVLMQIAKSKYRHILQFMSRYLYIVLALCTLFYDVFMRHGVFDEILFKIDMLLVGRLGSSKQVLDIFGLSIIGNPIQLGFYSDEATRYKLMCDNSFYYFCACYGIVYLVFIAGIIMMTKRMDEKTQICVIVYSIYAFIENRIIDIPSVFPLILVCYSWLSIQNIKEKRMKQ